MTTDSLQKLHRLGSIKIFDYFRKRSMPDFAEPLAAELILSFVNSSETQRANLLRRVTPELASVFGWYGRKLAGRAVREQSKTDVWYGIIALGISRGQSDSRDLLPPLSLLYNSALKLNDDPAALFEAAARLFSSDSAAFYTSFLGRTTGDKSIEVFGFSEGIGPLGFDYVPLLPEFGGPTPI